MGIPSEQATQRYSRCTITPKAEPFILAPLETQKVSILGVGNSHLHSLISATMSRGVVIASNLHSHPLHILSRADSSIPLGFDSDCPMCQYWHIVWHPQSY